MKKTILILFFIVGIGIVKTDAQVYSPQLAGFTGITTIYYPFGYYYGNVVNGVANGQGTFYYMDGSFYYGNFFQGFWDGPGVIVSRTYGYISGCFSKGVYMGMCQNVYNPYNDNTTVKQIVTQVQSNVPESNTSYTAHDPDGYKITKIDGDTELGKTVLGKYQ